MAGLLVRFASCAAAGIWSVGGVAGETCLVLKLGFGLELCWWKAGGVAGEICLE